MSVNINCQNVDFRNPGNACKEYEFKPTGNSKQDCLAGIKYGICQSKVNNCIVSENARIQQEYNNQLQDARNKRNQAQQAQFEWDARKTQLRADKLNEDRWMGRGGCGTNRGCDGGWHWVRNQNDILCEQVCRRNDDTADNEAQQQIIWERGYRPDNGPSDPGQPSLYQQINRATVRCCNNIINIINGQLENSDIVQSCSYTSSYSGEASKPDNTPSKKINETYQQNIIQQNKDNSNKNVFNIYLIIMILSILCAICICVILLITDHD